MSNETILAAIGKLRNDDVSGFQGDINDVLMSKIGDALDARRIQIASSLVGAAPATETETSTNED